MLYNKLIISINKLNRLFPNTTLLLSNTNIKDFSLDLLSNSNFLFLYDNDANEDTYRDLKNSLKKNIILIKEVSNYVLIGRLDDISNKHLLQKSTQLIKNNFSKTHTYLLNEELQIIENLISFYIFSPRYVDDIYLLSKTSSNFDVYKYS